ncbi:hypothetical protein [Actinoplanes xinjiangensis]|uniref:Uncharacterized protein n=1 Tax=Actinoplanes xinjiangensis TaxID=512350 RepID=A0A316EDB0_9ACTN|nr:hypothetical protein [Actinoplanes xinjiangensis]PWK28042.1 hypothetical protein BC793_15116 [Actinoplanes xinjiangensis]GIF45217.1 hypothetical protein Axi01nite_95280 [Actinoplanes xinjiangensis]
MPATRRRLSVFTLIIAMLGALLVAPARPVAAGPGGPGDPWTIGVEMDGRVILTKFPFLYYWSVEFLLTMPGLADGSDPRLRDLAALQALGSRDKYRVGQLEHLLTAWRDSRFRRALEVQINKIRKQYANKPELVAQRDAEIRKLFDEQWRLYLGRYVGIRDNSMRGKAFELAILRMLGVSLDDEDYAYDEKYPKVPGQKQARRPDLLTALLKKLAEMKTGDVGEIQKIRDTLQIARHIGAEQMYLYLLRVVENQNMDDLRDLMNEIVQENANRTADTEFPS